MTAGRGPHEGPGEGQQPSWEQLITGAHPAFHLAGRGSRPLAPRHGRSGWRDDEERFDPMDLGPLPEDDGMGWGDAAAWSVAAGGLTVLIAARIGELVG